MKALFSLLEASICQHVYTPVFMRVVDTSASVNVDTCTKRLHASVYAACRRVDASRARRNTKGEVRCG